MTYQIPQQLEYKEKIMFGLTFKQLAYAFSFGFVCVIIFKYIGSEYLKYPLIVLLATIAVCFMFFDLGSYIKNYYVFLKFQKVSKKDPKLQEFIGVKSIEKDLIMTSKGKKIAILKVQPLNFSLKPKPEQESIIFSFQKFLNSLDFSTQILMMTESINLEDYLSVLKIKQDDEEFLKIYNSYRDFLKDTITSKKLMNRVFYIIIPEQSEIGIQVDICIERLFSMNLKAQRLGDAELKKVLVKFFSGDGQGELIESISPNEIDNQMDYLKINDNNFYRVIYASGYPRLVEEGFLDKIVSSLGDFNLSIHIKPYPIDRTLIDLNRELQKQQADLYAMQSKGISNPSLEIQQRDTRQTLEDLQKGKDRLFNIGLYISCRADSIEALNLLTKKVESELNSIMIIPKVSTLRMLQGFKACAPLGIDELNQHRNVTTEALSAFFPFTSQFLQVDNTGVWLGSNKNNIPIIKDIFNLPNPNGLVLAQSGGGKSYFCKLLITRYLLNGTKVIVIDPQGEYRNIVKKFKGQIVDLSRESDTIINPLDLMGHDYAEKRLSLMDLMQVMLGKLSEPQKAFIDRAISEAYRKKKILDEPKTWAYDPPVLGDVLFELKKIEKKATQMEKTTVRSLVNRLEMYVTGVFKFLNRKTEIEFDNKFVCFDIGNLPKQVKPAVMFLVLDYVYMKMKSDLERKILLIDESWSLLSRTEDAGYIFEIVKTCRKFNMGLLLINQEVEGLFSSSAGKSVLANSAYTLLMRQKPAVIDNICNTFNLSPSEKSHLLTASIGEGLLIMEDDHSKIKVIASPEEHKLITTNPNETKEDKTNQKTPNNLKIKVDDSKDLIRQSGCNKEEIKYLLEKGFKLSKQKSFITGKKNEYLIRERPNESLTHTFLVLEIKYFLEKNNISVQTFATKKPDLVFKIAETEYALEIETGSAFSKISRLKEKVNLLNKDYTKWFFVVTNKNLVQKYRKFGNVIDPRWVSGFLNKLIKTSKNSPA
jgi:hypothetical protein